MLLTLRIRIFRGCYRRIARGANGSHQPTWLASHSQTKAPPIELNETLVNGPLVVAVDALGDKLIVVGLFQELNNVISILALLEEATESFIS